MFPKARKVPLKRLLAESRRAPLIPMWDEQPEERLIVLVAWGGEHCKVLNGYAYRIGEQWFRKNGEKITCDNGDWKPTHWQRTDIENGFSSKGIVARGRQFAWLPEGKDHDDLTPEEIAELRESVGRYRDAPNSNNESILWNAFMPLANRLLDAAEENERLKEELGFARDNIQPDDVDTVRITNEHFESLKMDRAQRDDLREENERLRQQIEDTRLIEGSSMHTAQLKAERDDLRAKLDAMHRRAQKAESIIAQSGIVEGRPRGNEERSLGRALANYAAADLRRKLDAAVELARQAVGVASIIRDETDTKSVVFRSEVERLEKELAQIAGEGAGNDG